MPEEEEEEETRDAITSVAILNVGLAHLKTYFNSLRGLNNLITSINEEGLDINMTFSDILREYISLNRTDIDSKISELEKTKILNNRLHLALLHLESGRTPSGPYYKTTEAGQYLYSLYGVEKSTSACRRLINNLINKEDGRGLVARGPDRGSHKTIYESDIDKWYNEFGTDLKLRQK
ncbi:MAG: hypothetical protein ABFS32_08200 [Bacteroidota bacterium]